jgi:hypothetical protein
VIEGEAEGNLDGAMDGVAEGTDVTGEAVTGADVAIDGEAEGNLDGFIDGVAEGTGDEVGDVEGICEGSILNDGAPDGRYDGLNEEREGTGVDVATVGAMVGTPPGPVATDDSHPGKQIFPSSWFPL